MKIASDGSEIRDSYRPVYTARPVSGFGNDHSEHDKQPN